MASAIGYLVSEANKIAVEAWARDAGYTFIPSSDRRSYEIKEIEDEDLKKLNQFLDAQNFTKAGRRNN